jgi:transposase
VIKVELTKDEVVRLQQLFRQSRLRGVRDRAQAVLMAAQGRPRGQIALDLCVTPRTVQRWINAWLERQDVGLEPGKPPGKLPLLAASLARTVRQWVIDGPAACGMKLANWTHQTLAEHVGKMLGIRLRRSAMGAFCRRHDIRLYRPTYRYLRGDPAKQATAQAELAELKKGPIRMSSCS